MGQEQSNETSEVRVRLIDLIKIMNEKVNSTADRLNKIEAKMEKMQQELNSLKATNVTRQDYYDLLGNMIVSLEDSVSEKKQPSAQIEEELLKWPKEEQVLVMSSEEAEKIIEKPANEVPPPTQIEEKVVVGPNDETTQKKRASIRDILEKYEF